MSALNYHLSFAVLMLVLVSPLQAQPISQSMSECAALYRVVACRMSGEERAEKLNKVADDWMTTAVATAQSEGHSNPAAYVQEKSSAKYDGWYSEGLRWFLTEDFRDWTAYCRSLGKNRGMALGLE